MASSVSSGSSSSSSSEEERRREKKRKERKEEKKGKREHKKSKDKDKDKRSSKRKKDKDKDKKKRHKSSGREDVVRSVISGKRIRRQIDETEADIAARQEREMRLRLLNEDEDQQIVNAKSAGEKAPTTMQEFAAARMKAARSDPKLMAQLMEEAKEARKAKRNKVSRLRPARARRGRAGAEISLPRRAHPSALGASHARHARTPALVGHPRRSLARALLLNMLPWLRANLDVQWSARFGGATDLNGADEVPGARDAPSRGFPGHLQ